MVHAPGYLDDLDAAGLAAWAERLQETVKSAAEAGKAQWNRLPAIVPDGTPGLGGIASIEWPPDPIRILDYLPNEDPGEVGEFLDWMMPKGQLGRILTHEEYLEWRVVRKDGVIQRIEMTCETPDYMAHVAGHNPERLLKLAAEFSGEEKADAQDIFGVKNYKSLTPEKRFKAFWERHVAESGIPTSNYANGTKAMLCMSQRVNSLAAAVNLAVRAAYPWGTAEGPLSGPQAIVGGQWAQACRNSDPNIADTIVRAVFGGLQIALVDPAGIYMLPYETDQVTLDGAPLPPSWLNYSRGSRAGDNPTGRDLYQRLVIKPPAGSDKTIEDLRDANGDPIRHGLQLARHQSVSILYRAKPGTVDPILFDRAPTADVCGLQNEQAGRYQAYFIKFQEIRNGANLLVASRQPSTAVFDV